VIQPLFECKTDHEIMYLFAKKLGFAEQLCKNIKVVNNEPVIEDILREINRSCWTIGYTGCSPERLKLHMQNKHTFNPTTLLAEDGPCKGDYYGLPWPCWGTPEMKHPGHAHPVRHAQAGGRGRPAVPRQLGRRAQRRDPAGGRRLDQQGQRARRRLSRSSTTCS
jgi:hypothetical protein